jgi:hypothetical protein
MSLFRRIKESIELRSLNTGNLPVAFIVSTGRTGTQFFEQFFNQIYPEVLCFHEPKPDLFEVGLGQFRKEKPVNLDQAIIYSRLNQIRAFQKSKKELYLESNPNAFCLIEPIRKAFPRVKFIRIVRDPISYLMSAYSKSPTGDQVRFFYANNDGRKRLTPFDIGDDSAAKDWNSYGRFERIAWFWNASNQIMEKSLSNGNDSITLRFEEIFNKDHSFAAIQRMVEFLGLDPGRVTAERLKDVMSHKANQTVEKKIDGPEKWTKEQIAVFNRLTEEMRLKFNYPKL